MTTRTRRTTGRLHIDPATGATVLDADAPAVVNPDGTATQETVDMLQHNGMATPALDEDPKVNEQAIKARQNAERKAAKEAALAAKAPKAARTAKAVKATAPTAKKAPAKKADPNSKAARVRALLDQGKTVRECADALKEHGVTWSYAWDVAAAWEKKTGKVVIPSHGAPKAAKVAKAPVPKKAPASKTAKAATTDAAPAA